MNGTLSRMGRPKKPELTEPVRIPQSVLKRVRRIAAHQGIDPGDYIASKLSAHLDKDEARMLQEIEKEKRPGEE